MMQACSTACWSSASAPSAPRSAHASRLSRSLIGCVVPTSRSSSDGKKQQQSSITVVGGNRAASATTPLSARAAQKTNKQRAIGGAAARTVLGIEAAATDAAADAAPDDETTTTTVMTNVAVTDERPRPRRRTYGAMLGSLAMAAPVLLLAGDALAAGWYNDVGPAVGGGGGGFVGGVGGGGFSGEGAGDAAEELYDYGTKDLAVDLASPLVAYKVVSWAGAAAAGSSRDCLLIVYPIHHSVTSENKHVFYHTCLPYE